MVDTLYQHKLYSQAVWVQILTAHVLPSNVPLNKLLQLSVPPFLHLYYGSNSGSQLTEYHDG